MAPLMGTPPDGLRFGPFRLDPAKRVLWRGDEVVPAPRALDLLVALAEQHGDVVPKQTLMDRVWPGTFVEEANLSVNVSALRKAPRQAARRPSLHRDAGPAWVSAWPRPCGRPPRRARPRWPCSLQAAVGRRGRRVPGRRPRRCAHHPPQPARTAGRAPHRARSSNTAARHGSAGSGARAPGGRGGGRHPAARGNEAAHRRAARARPRRRPDLEPVRSRRR